MISRGPVPRRALLENGIRYRDSDFTVANSALQRDTNISKSEIITKWSVFPGTVTYDYIYFGMAVQFKNGYYLRVKSISFSACVNVALKQQYTYMLYDTSIC